MFSPKSFEISGFYVFSGTAGQGKFAPMVGCCTAAWDVRGFAEPPASAKATHG
jgi:hypothetical protein